MWCSTCSTEFKVLFIVVCIVVCTVFICRELNLTLVAFVEIWLANVVHYNVCVANLQWDISLSGYCICVVMPLDCTNSLNYLGPMPYTPLSMGLNMVQHLMLYVGVEKVEVEGKGVWERSPKKYFYVTPLAINATNALSSATKVPGKRRISGDFIILLRDAIIT